MGGDSKVTPRWSERKGAFAEEREQLTADSLGSHPKETEVFSRDTSCCPHPTSPTGRDRQQRAVKFKIKQHQGLHTPAHFSAPSLKQEHLLKPPPRHSAGVNHPHSPSPGCMMRELAARDRWVSAVSGSVAFGGCWQPNSPPCCCPSSLRGPGTSVCS